MQKTRKYILAAIISTGAAAMLLPSNNHIQSRNVDMFTVFADDLGVSSEDLEFNIEDEQKYTQGNILQEKVAMYPEFVFEHTDSSAYLLKNANLKKEPYDDADDAISIDKFEEIKLTGTNDLKYWEVSIDNETYYIDKDLITTDYSHVKQLIQEEKEAQRRAEQERMKTQVRSHIWNGSVLTPSKGVNYGPSGKETYYNLPMSGVVSIMRSMGNNDPYWVRDDGCKMLGNYIIVAANLKIHPRGSLIETSLGTAIVCDTGGFAASNPNQLDIAVSW